MSIGSFKRSKICSRFNPNFLLFVSLFDIGFSIISFSLNNFYHFTEVKIAEPVEKIHFSTKRKAGENKAHA